MAKYNLRGVVTRDVFEGGKQDRELADGYRAGANALRNTYPKTARMLERIAKSYDADAKAESASARSDRLKWGQDLPAAPEAPLLVAPRMPTGPEAEAGTGSIATVAEKGGRSAPRARQAAKAARLRRPEQTNSSRSSGAVNLKRASKKPAAKKRAASKKRAAPKKPAVGKKPAVTKKRATPKKPTVTKKRAAAKRPAVQKKRAK